MWEDQDWQLHDFETPVTAVPSLFLLSIAGLLRF